MATYVAGDLQGCLDELEEALDHVRFDAGRDRLILAGDIVNRGPRSLDSLRFIRSLGAAGDAVLGNHDLHLLAAAAGVRAPKKNDTLQEILDAPDREALLTWLMERPLALWLDEFETLVIHAGLPPEWTLEQALVCSDELSTVLRTTAREAYLGGMYGNLPDGWDPKLRGQDRLRFITNAFTRTRYVHADGRLDMEFAGPPGSQPRHLTPWFAHPERRSAGTRIVFGHWATLQNEAPLDPIHNVVHLDTGCVWGGTLSVLRLDDGEIVHVPSRQPRPPQQKSGTRR